MLEIIKNLSNKLGIDEKTVSEKLGLTPEADYKKVNEVLGLYASFNSKEDYTKAINSKIDNIYKEKDTALATLKSENEKSLQEKDKVIDDFKSKFNTIINSRWEANKISGKAPLDKLDINKLDINNLDKSLLKFAQENNITVTPIKPIYQVPNTVINQELGLKAEISGGAVRATK